MGLETTIEKLDKYLDRLQQGKAKKIKPSHLAKVERKLKAREEMLLAELDETRKDSKRDRLKGKLALVREQLERADWLRRQLDA